MATLKTTVNSMVDQLSAFASEVRLSLPSSLPDIDDEHWLILAHFELCRSRTK